MHVNELVRFFKRMWANRYDTEIKHTHLPQRDNVHKAEFVPQLQCSAAILGQTKTEHNGKVMNLWNESRRVSDHSSTHLVHCEHIGAGVQQKIHLIGATAGGRPHQRRLAALHLVCCMYRV